MLNTTLYKKGNGELMQGGAKSLLLTIIILVYMTISTTKIHVEPNKTQEDQEVCREMRTVRLSYFTEDKSEEKQFLKAPSPSV